MSTTLIALATTPILALCAWLDTDYRAWIAFGTGGTPANLQGYTKITKFRILRALSGDDLKDPSPLSSNNGPSYLQIELPKRFGQPPRIISRTLPQRQEPVALENKAYERLHDLPKNYADQLKDALVLDKSISEGLTTDAIYSHSRRTCGVRDPNLGNEVAHVHPQDNSLHVWSTQADAKKAVAAGWGERFPLASLRMVDPGWTFVCAPRDMK